MPRLAAQFVYLVILPVLALSACGGGGDGGGNGGNGNIIVAAPTNAGGIWEGSTFDDRTGLTFQTAGVVTENGGEGRFINESGVQFILSGMSGTDGVLNATITAIAPLGSVFLDGTVLTRGTLSGRVVERQSLEGDWSLNTGETGSVTMAFDNNYMQGSNLTTAQGLWNDSFGNSWNVSSTGEIFSQDSSGCVANGRVSIINQSYNAYDVAMTLSGPCGGLDGNYDGLAVTETDGVAANNLLVVQANNDEFIVTDVWARSVANNGGPYMGPVARDADVLSFQQEFWSVTRATTRCGNCHNQSVGQTPMFVRDDDVNLAYDIALTVVDTTDPAASRVVQKVASGHNCWLADNAACGATMTTWIENWINSN